jgi:hypothetical protein
MAHYVEPNSCPDKLSLSTLLPKLQLTNRAVDTISKRTTSVSVLLTDDSKDKQNLNIAWIGPWGSLEFSPVVTDGSGQSSATVPTDLYGHVWAVLVSGQGVKLQGLAQIAIAGPEMVWVT